MTESQAKKLAKAGLYAYNHNIDTSEEHYKKIISTRGYNDRLKTIKNASNSDNKSYQKLPRVRAFGELLATFGYFWSLFATFGNFWQLLAKTICLHF